MRIVPPKKFILATSLRYALMILPSFGPFLCLGCNSVHQSSGQLKKTPLPIVLRTSANPSTYGDMVTFTATFNGSSTTGSLVFSDGSNTLGQATLGGTSASFTTRALSVGNHQITASLTGPDDTQPLASGTIIETISQATPALVWAVPGPIQYGTALGATQLDASTTTPGSFAYNPAPGTILTAGTQTLSVTFSPTDTADYTTATKTVALNITPATPVVTWEPLSPIFSGTALTSLQLSASSNVPGTFVYSPPLDTVVTAGSQTLSVTFTPFDSVDFNSVAKTVGLTVLPSTSSPGHVSFGFSLPISAATSAGIYDDTGTMVRTLWSNKQYSQGPHLESWDGKDDYGNQIVNGTFDVRVLYNNVSYEWGMIGETSPVWEDSPNGWTSQGKGWDSQGTMPSGMAIAGDSAYVSNAYSEGLPGASTFALSNPQLPSGMIYQYWCDQFESVATDGKLVYFLNNADGVGTSNEFSGLSSFVVALSPTTFQVYDFPSGIPTKLCVGKFAFKGVIDPSSSEADFGTGLAVQTQGNLLAVAHGAPYSIGDNSPIHFYDRIMLFDKTSGAARGEIQIQAPKQLAFAPSGDLWVLSGQQVVLVSSV